MEAWKSQLIDRIENVQNYLESKQINSFEAVKEFFKNVFINFLNEIEDNKTGITEKRHELYLFIGEMSIAIIDQGDNITVWKLSPTVSKIMALLSFEKGHCFVNYVDPVKVTYLCEDEIEKIFELGFLQTENTH